MRLYDKTQINPDHLLYNNHALWALTVPVMVEQFLNCLMGTADSMMVSNVGSAALSAVSLVDTINVLIFQVFTALAAGGTIICSQYLGHGEPRKAKKAAEQVTLTMFVISILLTAVFLLLKRSLLGLIFGQVDEDVMAYSLTYFFITVLSYPALALFDAGAAFMRAEDNSRFPMRISLISNLINICGNAVLIFGLHMGVEGAAIATTSARYISAVVIMAELRKTTNVITIDHYSRIRPEWGLILRILAVGVPSGIENGSFQFGKLAIQSSVSTLGTTAIAAQAMAALLEQFNGMVAMAIGIAMMTVVGQAIGASRKEEAKYYIVKMTIWAQFVMMASVMIIFVLCRPITGLAHMDPEAAAMCLQMVTIISCVKPFLWTLAFLPAYGMRAAGDVKFSMATSMCTMWFCRVAVSTCLIRFAGFGILGAWIGMFCDWGCRSIIFTLRFLHGRWLDKKVIE